MQPKPIEIDNKDSLRGVSYGASHYLLTSSTEEKKVAAFIKKQNHEIKKEQEDVHKLLEKIVTAIERSCSG